MLPRTPLRVALFALLAVFLCVPPARAQQTQPPAEIRYHFGDESDGKLGWANPNFDDSAWPIAKDGSWPTPPIDSDGFVWVRYHIPIRADASGPLAVRSWPAAWTTIIVGDIYAGGLFVGRQGSLPPHPDFSFDRWDTIFDLPASAAVPGKTAVVALSTWYPTGSRVFYSSASWKISVDASRILRLAQRADHESDLYSNGLDLALDIGLAILGIGMLAAWRWTGERDLLVFAWTMIPQALFLLASNSSVQGMARASWQVWPVVVCGPLTLFMFALIELNWTVHRLRAPLLKRLGQAGAIAYNLSIVALFLPTSPGIIAHWAILVILPAELVFQGVIVGVNVWAILTKRTNPLLVLALLANAAAALLMDLHILPGRIMLGPFSEPTIGLADFVIDIAVFILLSLSALRAWRARDELRVEIDAAREVQQRLIAPAVDLPGFKIQSVYAPSKEVGGDFFRVLAEPDGSVLIVVGDVSGKGLRAAMTVSAIIGALRTMPELPLPRMLGALNRGLFGQIGGFVTCCVARIAQDGSATIANAGNLAPYINGTELSLGPSLPLGLSATAEYEEQPFRLEPDQTLTFVSDGVVEARNASGELYGFDRTQAISNQSANAIAEAATQFGQEDDITVLSVARAANLNPAMA
jgi:sigma-B regulation protein RsbU (phosphoserine phosphatase)